MPSKKKTAGQTKKTKPQRKQPHKATAASAEPAAVKKNDKLRLKPAAKPTAKKQIVKPKPAPVAAVPKQTVQKVESLLITQGVKFVKIPFFFDIEEDNAGKRRYVAHQKLPEKPTTCSRPKISGNLDSKNLVELLSQQLEYENRTYFEGCEGQICVKCNVNNVDAKFYVDKSLGYCTECAILLNLGQSKEGVFSDAQMELMRRSMEKSMENVKDIDENDIESALGDMDNLELEETLLAVEEAANFNV